MSKGAGIELYFAFLQIAFRADLLRGVWDRYADEIGGRINEFFVLAQKFVWEGAGDPCDLYDLSACYPSGRLIV